MKYVKVKIIKENKVIYESSAFNEYTNKKYLTFDIANLRDANLRDADLRDADLTGANLTDADLRDADLTGANLTDADLTDADLRGANLRDADLTDADLRDADLRDANLRDADLRGANLRDADLTDADLRDADLRDADLTGANLTDADLRDADLTGANLTDASLDKKEKIRQGLIIKKNTIVYKKCAYSKIAELELKAGSIVFSINNKKCRTINPVKVISINGDNTKGLKAYSTHDSSFEYEVGKTAKPKNPNLMYNVECGGGIHFFWTKEEAENY